MLARNEALGLASMAVATTRQQANAQLVAELQQAIGTAAYAELREWSSLYRQRVLSSVDFTAHFFSLFPPTPISLATATRLGVVRVRGTSP